MDVYMIVLVGGGDVFTRLVNEETWNWIMNQEYETNEENGNDLLTPPNVRKDLWERDKKEQYGKQVALEEYIVHVTSGSYKDDRAMAARGLLVNGETAEFYDETDAESFAETHALTIKATYEGSFY